MGDDLSLFNSSDQNNRLKKKDSLYFVLSQMLGKWSFVLGH